MASPDISVCNLDHLGLYDELGIADMIDTLLPKKFPAKISNGQAFVAMLLNGSGFHSGTLHMFPLFFANKHVKRLNGLGIKADYINDDVLGRCMMYPLSIKTLKNKFYLIFPDNFIPGREPFFIS